MSVEMINAIAGLWKLAAVVFLIIIVIVFRNQIGKFIARITKFKAGKAVVELARAPDEAQAAEASKEEVAAPPENAEKTGRDADEVVKASSGSIGNVFSQFRSGDVEGAEESFKKLQESEHNQAKKRSDELVYLFLRFRFAQDAEALEKLKKKSQEEQAAHDAYYWIGACYNAVDDFGSAAAAYEESARHASTDSERVSATTSAAKCFYQNGQRKEAFDRLAAELGKALLPIAVSKIYLTLATIYKQEENQELQAIALEKAIESNPNNTRLRFDAAYAYGEGKCNSLSLLHYKNLLWFAPADLATLNNLGFAYNTLGMPMKSVEYYGKAIEGNHTLAMANLAHLYIDAGLAKNAKQILDKAKVQDEVSPNVGSAMSLLSNKEEEEAKVEKECFESAREQQKFLLSFAEAYFTKANDPNSLGFVGFWQSEKGYALKVFKDGSNIQGEMNSEGTKLSFKGSPLNRGLKIDGYTSTTTSTHIKDMLIASELGNGHGYGYLTSEGEELHLVTIKKNGEKWKHRLWVFRRSSNKS